MAREKKDRRRRQYKSPGVRVLDAESAKVLLEEKGDLSDPGVQKMLEAIDSKLRKDKTMNSKLDKSA